MSLDRNTSVRTITPKEPLRKATTAEKPEKVDKDKEKKDKEKEKKEKEKADKEAKERDKQAEKEKKEQEARDKEQKKKEEKEKKEKEKEDKKHEKDKPEKDNHAASERSRAATALPIGIVKDGQQDSLRAKPKSPRASVVNVDEMAVNLDEDLARLWKRPFLASSTCKDLGRLARGIELIDQRGAPLMPSVVLFKGDADPDANPPRIVYNFLVALSKAVESDQVTSAIESNYWARIADRDAGDLGGQLSTLFGPAEKGGALTMLTDDSKMIRILKVLNQEVLAPPALKMKIEIHKHLHYKDLRGQWTITITLRSNGAIVVSHNKREQSADATPENQFEFGWSLVMNFTQDASKFTSAFQISEYIFNEKTSRQKQNEVKKILEPFVVPELPYRHILSRPATNLGAELLRFVKVTEVIDETQARVYGYNGVSTGLQSCLQMLEALATLMEPAILPGIEDHYRRVVREADPVGTMQQFLLQGPITEHTKMLKLLKCLNQELASPAVMRLRATVHDQLPYKDVKGSWQVRIIFVGASVLVIHSKREQQGASGSQPDDYFEFDWELSLMHDLETMTLQRVSFLVTSISFAERIAAPLRQKVLGLLKPYMAPDCAELITVPFSISELLNAVIGGLSMLPEPPFATLNHVKDALPIIDLLKRVDRTLTQLPQSLPQVGVSVRQQAPKSGSVLLTESGHPPSGLSVALAQATASVGTSSGSSIGRASGLSYDSERASQNGTPAGSSPLTIAAANSARTLVRTSSSGGSSPQHSSPGRGSGSRLQFQRESSSGGGAVASSLPPSLTLTSSISSPVPYARQTPKGVVSPSSTFGRSSLGPTSPSGSASTLSSSGGGASDEPTK